MHFETYYIIGDSALRNLADSLSKHPSDTRFEKEFTTALSEALAFENDKLPEGDIADPLSYENRCIPVHPNDDSWTKMSGALGFHCMGVVPGHARPGRSPGLKDYLPAAEILNKIKPRIEELSRLALEEGLEGQSRLSSDSYDGLVRFLNKIAALGLNLIPGLTLTYEGNLKAKWHSSPDERLALEFVSPDLLKFLFFRPDPLSPDKTHRISGSWSVENFLDSHPRALEFLRDLDKARSMRTFSRLYHSSREKTSKTFRGASPTGFAGYHSGAVRHPRELDA